MRGIWNGRASEDAGMTLIKIVVAAVILFIILTGVLGLIGQTTMMGAQAKEMNVTNNAVNAYVEWVRSLPFEQVANSDETSGSIETTSFAMDGYTVLIEPDVRPGVNDAIKELFMTITVTRVDGLVESSSTTIMIRDKDQYITQANRDPLTDPVVAFTPPTPPENTVVWDGYWKDSAGVLRPLALAAAAEARADREIQTASIWCDDTWLLEDSVGGAAEWIVGEPQWTLSPYFTWNTRQTDDGVDEYGVPFSIEVIPDGVRTVSVIVFDSEDIQVYDTRHFLVDNQPPGNVPGPPTATVSSATKAVVTWPGSMDGTTPTYKYWIDLWRQKSEAEFLADNSSYWYQIPSAPNKYPLTTTWNFTTAQPFQRYFVRVKGVSPRPLVSPAWAVMEQAFTMRPLVTGTYTVVKASGKYTTTVNCSVTPPAFFTWGDPMYEWFYQYEGGAVGSQFSGTTFTKSFGPRSTAPYQISVWCKVYYRPAGLALGGGSNETILSNKVGPTSLSQTPGTTFPEGVWTW